MSERAGRRTAAGLALEMLVVVASILVAFALDAWWNDRAETRVVAPHLPDSK